MSKRVWQNLVIALLMGFSCPQWALAAPGGQIALSLFKTLGGKALIIGFGVVLLPIGFYIYFKEYQAEKRTLQDLARLAQIDPRFNWTAIKARITACFESVHKAWQQEDLTLANDYMTFWYRQNQQITTLNQWQKEGLINHCQMQELINIRPIYLRYQHNDDQYNNSSLVAIITADIEDYLAERDTGKIVEGSKGFSAVDKVWTFIIQDGQWVVSNIEDGDVSLTYARLANEVPELSELPQDVKASSAPQSP